MNFRKFDKMVHAWSWPGALGIRNYGSRPMYFNRFHSIAAVVLSSTLAFSNAASAAGRTSCPPLLQHTFPRLQDDQPQSLCQYTGKVLLVVNTASYCGFTGQYAGLEALYARHKDQGLVVLGFPSNDFKQETGSNQQIGAFCQNTFGVKFPMFAKSSVKGAQASPFYRQLAAATGKEPGWNFYKYLIGRDGKVASAYSSMTGPANKGLQQEIDRLLAQPTPAGQ